MKKAIYFFMTFWILLWVQVVSNHFLGGTLFSVQWILLAVLHYGLMRGPWVGESMGFVWGLLIDASSLGLMGLHAVLYTLAGYAAGMFRRQLDVSKMWTQTIFSWMASVVYFALYLVIARFLSAGEEPFQWGILTVPVVNALLAPVVFRVLDYWATLWDMVPEERTI
jgi:rod shape-determining protein MreD